MNELGKNHYSVFVPEIIGTNPDGSLKTKDGDFFDMMCGSSCASFGSSALDNVIIKKALERFTKENVPLNTYTHETIWRREAEDELRKHFPNYDFLFCCGGCEAVEIAIKIVKSLRGKGVKFIN